MRLPPQDPTKKLEALEWLACMVARMGIWRDERAGAWMIPPPRGGPCLPMRGDLALALAEAGWYDAAHAVSEAMR